MKFVSILDRYVFLEMITPFTISMLFCSSIFIMRHLLEITDMIINHGASLLAVCLLMLYAMPYFLQYIVPMSVMLAILMVCLRMTSSNEIIALNSSGISVYFLLKPVILFGTIGLIITGAVTIYALPKAETLFRSLSRDIIVSGISVGLKERTFNNTFDNLIIYVGQLDVNNGYISDIFIEDTRICGVINTITAPKGLIKSRCDEMSVSLKLLDGVIGRIDTNKTFVQRMEFDAYDLNLNIEGYLSKTKLCDVSIKEMGICELKTFISSDNFKDENYYKALVQYYKAFAIPFSCLSMGILALSLGIYSSKFSRSFGIGLSIVLFLGYYCLFSLAVALSESGLYSPMICIWLPDVLTGLLGLFVLARVVNGKFFPFNIAELLSSKRNFLFRKTRK